MATSLRADRLKQLWQLPLLFLALGLFTYAAYLFIDPQPGLSVHQKISRAEDLLAHERPEAAMEQLNALLEAQKLPISDEARIHLLLAECLDAGQRLHRINSKINHEQIVEQTRIALAEGAKAGGDVYRRLGESYEFLGQPTSALENYRRAMAMDPTRSLALQRKVIDLQLQQTDTAPAEASLDEYLKDQRLASTERGWAMGQKAELLSKRGAFVEARALLDQVLRLDADPTAQGEAHYHLGYIALRAGEDAEAERLLRVARDQLKVGHPLDAEAALLLGNIRQKQNDPDEAISFYQSVLESHPESHAAPLALLGRGTSRISKSLDAAGLSDLHEVTNQILAKASRESYKPQVIAGLHEAAGSLTSRGDHQGALELLIYEQSLNPEPAAEFYGRLAQVYEHRADQLEQSTEPPADEAAMIRRGQQVAEFRSHAGDAYIAYSRAVTLADDKGHAESMWKGVNLYDRAGDTQKAISALALFIAERPDDGQTPDALLRLGRAYQAAGQIDKAIEAFQHDQFRYPKSLAASQSGVPLAQAFIAKGPEHYGKAEAVLKSVIDSPLIRPDAQEFRLALFEMAQLYYRTTRYEEAIARLEELKERYPADSRMGELLFLMGDSYRKSATLLVKLASANPADAAGSAATAQAEAAAAKRDRLGKSKQLFDQVIDHYADKPPTDDLQKLYLKLANFYRGDCMYDLGEYEQAIKLYDGAALRYQDEPAALAAYVQIVNAYCALGRNEEARTANERAKWLLRRMPASAFGDGSVAMPREYWEQWLKWTNEAGIFPKGAPFAAAGSRRKP